MFPTLKKRLIVSGILILTLLALLRFDYIIKGQTGFYLIVAVVSSLCFYEFVKLFEHIDIKLPWHFSVVTGLCGIIMLWLIETFPLILFNYKGFYYVELAMWKMPMLITLAVFLVIAVLYYLKQIESFHHLLILSAGFFYIYLSMWTVLRMRAHSIMLVLYFIAIVKIADSVAYFFGTKFGRHKLAAHISPNKTVEGFVATIIITPVIGAILYFLMVHAYSFSDFPLIIVLLVINLVVVFIAQMGDLVESYIKRKCLVKDSGSVLGPLGGILDLTDSLLLAAPAAWFLFTKIN